jgi:hypothetical protein
VNLFLVSSLWSFLRKQESTYFYKTFLDSRFHGNDSIEQQGKVKIL